jgi:hypothetical protein
MGVRVDAVKEVAEGRAWIAIAGRNTDATTYRRSELWAKKNGKWRGVEVPLPADRARLPGDFPPAALSDYDRMLGVGANEAMQIVLFLIMSDVGVVEGSKTKKFGRPAPSQARARASAE